MLVPHPTTEGADAGEQLEIGEWLGEIVVGAEIEPLDAVAERAGGGEHEDARRVVLGNERAADGVAAQHGQIAIEDDDVDIRIAGGYEGLGARARDVDEVALAPQSVGERVGEVDLVFYQEQSHGTSVACAFEIEPAPVEVRCGLGALTPVANHGIRRTVFESWKHRDRGKDPSC